MTGLESGSLGLYLAAPKTVRGSIPQGLRGSISGAHPELIHSSLAWMLWPKEMGMARVPPCSMASLPHEGPKGGEQRGSQVATLLFAVLMSEYPVKGSLVTWAEPHGVKFEA